MTSDVGVASNKQLPEPKYVPCEQATLYGNWRGFSCGTKKPAGIAEKSRRH